MYPARRECAERTGFQGKGFPLKSVSLLSPDDEPGPRQDIEHAGGRGLQVQRLQLGVAQVLVLTASVAGDGTDQAFRAPSHRHPDAVRPDPALAGVGQDLSHGAAVAVIQAQAPIDIAGGGVVVEVEVEAGAAGTVHQSQEVQVHRLPPAPVDAAEVEAHGASGAYRSEQDGHNRCRGLS